MVRLLVRGGEGSNAYSQPERKISSLFFDDFPQGRCQKKRIYLGLCPKLWVGGSKVPNFLVKITIQLFLLQSSRNVLKHAIHKWGGHIWPFHDDLRPQRQNFVRKISHFFKKIKCSKQPKKQNKLNFYFSLSGAPNMRGGWVGSDVWDKVPKKRFFYTFPQT